MGKLAKLFMFLIFVVAFGLPRVAIDITDRIRNRDETITDLRDTLKDTEEKLVASEESRRILEDELDAKKRKLAQTEEDLASTRRQLSITKGELSRKKEELSTCIGEREKLRQNVKKLEEEKSALEAQLHKVNEALTAIKRSIGIKVDAEATEGGKELSEQGKIIGISGSRFLTISLRTTVGGRAVPSLFVHRGGKVVGEAVVTKVHGAAVVVEAGDEKFLERLMEGDQVRVEGEQLLIPELLEGAVYEVSRRGFVSIDTDRKLQKKLRPVFLVYRDGDFIGKVVSEKTISLFVIVELRVGRGARIIRGDYLRMPR